MRIHHLNCSTFCPFGGHFMDRVSPGIGEAKLVCHCLLIETNDGLVLVDTGLGTRDVHTPRERMSSFFRHLLRPRLVLEETALAQINRLGFRAQDVQHIILTHLDFDHAGGIDDFPNAQVHVLRDELSSALNPKSFISRGRYSPSQLSAYKTWNTYSTHGEQWMGFKAVKDLKGLPPEILMVPLVGHTEGHCGIAVSTDRGWLLHAGDAYFFRGELNHDYNCPPGLRGYQTMMEVNRRQRLWNQQRLRHLAFKHTDDVRIFSAHDAIEFKDLKEEEPRSLASEQAAWQIKESASELNLH